MKILKIIVTLICTIIMHLNYVPEKPPCEDFENLFAAGNLKKS